MTEQEIIDELLAETKDLKVWDIHAVNTLPELNEKLVLFQLSPAVKEALGYEKEEALYREILQDYNGTMILRRYHYVDLFNALKEKVKLSSPAPLKKLAKAAMLSSKYLGHYSSVENYQKHLKNVTESKAKLLSFLENVRKETSLPGMHFTKATLFYQEAGLLDIPSVTENSKNFIIEKEGLENDNHKIFFALMSLAKAGGWKGYELNQRIDCYDKKGKNA